MAEERYLIVVPQSLKRTFQAIAHNHSSHQGISRTLSSLLEIACWVGMSSDVAHCCNYCATFQATKALPSHPAPLQPVIASRPWGLVAVDILKVPMSAHGNQYILVAQDYFSKWPFAQAIPNQKTEELFASLRIKYSQLLGHHVNYIPTKASTLRAIYCLTSARQSM